MSRDCGISGRVVGPNVNVLSREFAAESFGKADRIGIVLELYPHGKAMAMKHRSLNHSQRRHRNSGPTRQQRSQVALHALLDIFQRLQRFFAIARQQIEAELRVEDVGLHFLEAENGDGLLLQLIEALLAALARRLENMNHAAAQRRYLGEPATEHGQGDGGRMRDHLTHWATPQ